MAPEPRHNHLPDWDLFRALREQYRLCTLTQVSRTGYRGKWAAQFLPFVFAALWLLSLAGSFDT